MGKFRSPRVVPRERVRSPKFESRRVKLLRDGCVCVARVKLGMCNVHRVHVTDIWSWYRVELRVGDHLGRSEELVSRCVECDLAEPESLASLGGSAPGVVDGILSQCNQYPNPSHNSALPQFLAHHNCEDMDPTDTPSAVPTALQAPKHCTHNPSTSLIKKCNHTNPMDLPYPPDPGEHVMERSATPPALVERDKLDPSSLAPPKGEMESSFNWTYLFKSPTSSTLCFGEPTLRKLNQVKQLCNPTSSTLCDFTLGKLNQETGFCITNHTPLIHTGTPFSMPKSSPGTNRASDCHSSLVTTPSSRLILDKPKIEVNKALIHHIGKNGEHLYGENFIYDFPKSWKHIKEVDWGDKLKFNYTTFGYMLMEIDWAGKRNYTSYGCPMANWKGHETHNPNHMNESLLSEVDWGAHDSSVFLFLVNIDYDAKPNESPIQGLWGELQHRTSSIPLIRLQTDSLATGQTGDDVFNSIPINPDPRTTHWRVNSVLSHLGSSTTMVSSSGETCHPCTSHYLVQAYGGIVLITRPTFMDISIFFKTTPHSSFHHLHTHTHTYTHTHTNYIYISTYYYACQHKNMLHPPQEGSSRSLAYGTLLGVLW